jgi:hypothetical protein
MQERLEQITRISGDDDEEKRERGDAGTCVVGKAAEGLSAGDKDKGWGCCSIRRLRLGRDPGRVAAAPAPVLRSTRDASRRSSTVDGIEGDGVEADAAWLRGGLRAA